MIGYRARAIGLSKDHGPRSGIRGGIEGDTETQAICAEAIY